MINLSNVSINFGTQDVLKSVNIQINSQEKIGIVGPNGQGKSTLFNLITYEIEPGEGTVTVPKNIKSSFFLYTYIHNGDIILDFFDTFHMMRHNSHLLNMYLPDHIKELLFQVQ